MIDVQNSHLKLFRWFKNHLFSWFNHRGYSIFLRRVNNIDFINIYSTRTLFNPCNHMTRGIRPRSEKQRGFVLS